MTKKLTPETTKVSPDEPKGEGTKLARVNDPAKLTDAKIEEITQDDGTDEAENSANADAAEALKQDRAEAKDKDEPKPYFHGQGGATGL